MLFRLQRRCFFLSSKNLLHCCVLSFHSLNYLAGTLLMYLTEREAFWTLVVVMKRPGKNTTSGIAKFDLRYSATSGIAKFDLRYSATSGIARFFSRYSNPRYRKVRPQVQKRVILRFTGLLSAMLLCYASTIYGPRTPYSLKENRYFHALSQCQVWAQLWRLMP